jgi:hypothetical protein
MLVHFSRLHKRTENVKTRSAMLLFLSTMSRYSGQHSSCSTASNRKNWKVMKNAGRGNLIFTSFTFLHLQIHRIFTCIGCPASSIFRHFEQQNLASDERHVSYLIISVKLFRIACIPLAASLNVRKLRPRFVFFLELPSEKRRPWTGNVLSDTVRNGVWDDGNVCPLQWRNLSASKNINGECLLPFTSEYLSSVSYLNM